MHKPRTVIQDVEDQKGKGRESEKGKRKGRGAGLCASVAAGAAVQPCCCFPWRLLILGEVCLSRLSASSKREMVRRGGPRRERERERESGEGREVDGEMVIATYS
jgi:hypothetical protein